MNKDECIREMATVLGKLRDLKPNEALKAFNPAIIGGQDQWAGTHSVFKEVSLLFDKYEQEIWQAFRIVESNKKDSKGDV